MKNLIELIKSKQKPIVIASQQIITAVKECLFSEKQLINLKFKTYSDVINDFCGYYLPQALINVVKSEQVIPEIADILLESTLYINGSDYQNEKITYLNKLKLSLNNHLVINEFAYGLYSDANIIIVNPNFSNTLFNKVYNDLITMANVIKYEFQSIPKDVVTIYKFANIKEEVEMVAIEIAKLLSQGINAEKIKIHSVIDDYLPVIDEIFNFYNIDINYNLRKKLSKQQLVKMFLKSLRQDFNKPFQSAVAIAIEEVASSAKLISPWQTKVYNSLINVLNEYLFFEGKVSEIYQTLEYVLKQTTISSPAISGVIEIIDVLNSYVAPDEYIFILGFNQNHLPKVIRDEDYLNDNDKKLLNLSTTLQINQAHRQNLRRIISQSNNILLSYSLATFDSTLERTSFIDELATEINLNEKKYENDRLISYSRARDEFRLAKLLDDYYAYNIRTDELELLLFNFKENTYLSYDNRFTVRNIDKIPSLMDEELSLSYTSINTYNNCAFKYFLERVLKINRPSNIAAIKRGNLFHFVLENVFLENDISPERITTLVDEFYQTNRDNSEPNEQVYAHIYTQHLQRIIPILAKNFATSEYDVKKLEGFYSTALKTSFKCELNGKIDVVLCSQDNNHPFAIVIDYKTGRNDIDYRHVPHGLDYQTLIYFYLLNNSNAKKYRFGGAYLLSLLPPNPFLNNPSKTEEDLLLDYLSWNGYTNSDLEIIKQIDPSINNRSFLKSMRLKKDGQLYSYSLNKVISESEFQNLLTVVEEGMYSVAQNIHSGEFSINPLRSSNGHINSCQYCQYGDICFKRTQDYRNIKIARDLDFLKEGVSDDSD